jgi:hypothetical protein
MCLRAQGDAELGLQGGPKTEHGRVCREGQKHSMAKLKAGLPMPHACPNVAIMARMVLHISLTFGEFRALRTLIAASHTSHASKPNPHLHVRLSES